MVSSPKAGGVAASTQRTIRELENKVARLKDRYTMPCPHCGKPILASFIASAAAQRASAMRKTRGAGSGRPPKMSPCPKCGNLFGAAELRAHKPRCMSPTAEVESAVKSVQEAKGEVTCA